MNPTYTDLAGKLPVADFVRLNQYLISEHTKRYPRVIKSVSKKARGAGYVGLVKYEPVENGNFPDTGEIVTNWLTDQLAWEVCEQAKASIGKRCLLFQINKDKSNDQPNGFRELAWIQVIE